MANPRLPELDWEVAVYRWVRAVKERLFPAAPAYDPERVARLDDQPGLGVLAQLIAGEPVRLQPARSEGGVRGAELLVPAACDLLPTREDNADLIRLRVLIAAEMRRWARERQVTPADDPTARQLQGIDLAEAAVTSLCDALPSVTPTWERLRDACAAVRPLGVDAADVDVETARRRLLGRTDPPARAPGVASPPVPLWGPLHPHDVLGALTGVPETRTGASTPTTEVDAPPVEAIKVVHLDERELEDQVLMHTFEKVETAEAFNGVVRNLDGADDLDEHLEALQEVELGTLIRGGDDAHSVLRADLGGGEVPDVEDVRPGEAGIAYDEWDGANARWRPAWCTVYPSAFPASDPTWAARAHTRLQPTVARVLRHLGVERARRRDVGRQRDGDDVDLDAWVDHHAAARAHLTDTARIWVRRERLLRDVSVTLLLDASLSADAWVSDRRTLDVTRDAAFVLGEIADALGDPLQLLAFATSTRHRCRVWTIKDFDTPWASSRARLGAIEPQGYTRIGAALRHAVATAAARPEPHRLVVLLTDGRPTDLDRYEGRYGVGDVRMAVRTAAAQGVSVQAIAVDPGSRDTLPALFGAGNWHVLSNPDDLPVALVKAYEAARRLR